MRYFFYTVCLMLINNFFLLAINTSTICFEKESNGLTYQDIAQHFDKTLKEATKQLKISESTLKKSCRKLGVKRWPFRKVNSIKKFIEISDEDKTDEMKKYLDLLYENPNTRLTDLVSKNDNNKYNRKRKLQKKQQAQEPKLKKFKIGEEEKEEICKSLIKLSNSNKVKNNTK